MFAWSAIVIGLYDRLPPPAVLYSLPILDPTAPHSSPSLTAIQILKWLEDIWKPEGIIIRLLENTRKHGLKNKNVKNELSLALACIFYTNGNETEIH